MRSNFPFSKHSEVSSKGFTFMLRSNQASLIANKNKRLRLFDMNVSHGFTFIEVLIAVTIVVVLGTLVLGSFVDQPKKGRDSKRKSDLAQLRTALESYNDDFGCYPQADMLSSCGQPFSTYTKSSSAYTKSSSAYLDKVPCDPKNKTPYVYIPDTSSSSCPSSYWVYTKLEYLKDPDMEKTGCSGGCGPGGAYNFRLGSPNAQ